MSLAEDTIQRVEESLLEVSQNTQSDSDLRQKHVGQGWICEWIDFKDPERRSKASGFHERISKAYLSAVFAPTPGSFLSCMISFWMGVGNVVMKYTSLKAFFIVEIEKKRNHFFRVCILI